MLRTLKLEPLTVVDSSVLVDMELEVVIRVLERSNFILIVYKISAKY